MKVFNLFSSKESFCECRTNAAEKVPFIDLLMCTVFFKHNQKPVLLQYISDIGSGGGHSTFPSFMGLVQKHSKLASLVRNDIWTCQIVKFALDFAIYKRFHSSQQKSPVGVAGSVLIYIFLPAHYVDRPIFVRFDKSQREHFL